MLTINYDGNVDEIRYKPPVPMERTIYKLPLYTIKYETEDNNDGDDDNNVDEHNKRQKNIIKMLMKKRQNFAADVNILFEYSILMNNNVNSCYYRMVVLSERL